LKIAAESDFKGPNCQILTLGIIVACIYLIRYMLSALTKVQRSLIPTVETFWETFEPLGAYSFQ